MQASNRTFICSVVFLDIVEYSKKPVAEQILLKERLNALLAEALANVAPNDRIILDTGDGAALSFLGDPEDALFVSLALRDAVATPQPAGPDMKMRIGINLGPVKLIKDLNGQPNIIGDGINVAQRVMGFAMPGQILVSRSYYEVVSCLSDGYVKLFHYEGSRTDKHVREHEVYAVQATSAALQLASGVRETSGPHEAVPEKTVALDRLAQSASLVTETLRRRPRVGTALAVVAILAAAVVLRLQREAPSPADAAEPRMAAVAPAVAVPAPGPAAPGEPGKAPVADRPVPAAPAVPAAQAPVEAPSAAPRRQAAVAKASIQFVILPWGEVYVDGKLLGVAPPLRHAELEPGRYRIEVRNADFPPYQQVVEARPGSRIRIRHRFR